MPNRKIKKKLAETPGIPGVYLMKNTAGAVIYVGKAVSLKRRIASYFQEVGGNTKNLVLSANIADFDCIPVASEAEALILENRLIKKYQPRYNTNLKDDKSYPLVKISGERFPSIRVVREEKDGSSAYFGPFTDVDLLRRVVKFIRRYYPLRDCRYDLEKRKVRLCTQYHIKRCSGPCEGRITEGEYRNIVKGMVSFWKGDYSKFKKELERQISAEIKNLRFEKAQEIKNRIFMLEAIAKRFPLRDERSLLSYGESNVLENMKKILSLDRAPYHIEGYDVSNISGEHSTASRVSFKGGVKDSENYRRYRIKYTGGIDDCRMLEEVLTRRFDPEKEKEEDIPDLILVDGGKGQLNAAARALKKLNVDVPVISLAKKNEDIYLSGRKEYIRLRPDSPELHLLQAVRNESHRFAVSYHRKLRSKSLLNAAGLSLSPGGRGNR